MLEQDITEQDLNTFLEADYSDTEALPPDEIFELAGKVFATPLISTVDRTRALTPAEQARILATFSNLFPDPFERLRDHIQDMEDLSKAQRPFLLPFGKFLLLWLRSGGSAFLGRSKPMSRRVLEDEHHANKLIRSTASNLSAPHEWYPLARSMRRRIVVHMGPTNSGKTYSALKSFVGADSGVYCGPLRLLAHEVHERVNGLGVPCSLVTGEMQVIHPDAKHIACTVEMASTLTPIKVAVIDEFQLLGDASRGWAWTRALLGIPADEIHLCGDGAALEVVRALCERVGDEMSVNRYERLSPLKMDGKAVGASPYKHIQRGDCVIAFSRKQIYKIKQLIEDCGVHKCCVVYGALPPHTRAEQARLFNDPQSGYDVMVASDAVGMGLNLNVRRIVFSSVDKFDGTMTRELTTSEIKQIAGRAGRFRSRYPTGLVTCFDPKDMAVLSAALQAPTPPLEQVGLSPTYEQLEMFYLSDAQDGKLSLPRTMNRFAEVARMERVYFLCDYSDKIEIARLIQKVPLVLKDRYTFCISPASVDNQLVKYYLLRYAQLYASPVKAVPVLVTAQTLANPVGAVPTGFLAESSLTYLSHLESIHQVLDLYLWLSYRLDKFTERERDKAAKLKNLVHYQINKLLAELGETRMNSFEDSDDERPGRERSLRARAKRLKRSNNMR